VELDLPPVSFGLLPVASRFPANLETDLVDR